MTDGAQKYLLRLFAVMGVFIAAVALVNWVINPLGIYRPPVIAGLNDTHPAAQLYAFIQKVETVKRLKPDAIITGTSRAEICLDPKPEFFPGLVPYNFALAAASVNEQRMALEFAQAVHPLKQAVITLDFFAFDARKKDTPAYDAARLSHEALSPVRALHDTYLPLLTIDALDASFKQVKFKRTPERFSYTKENGAKVPNDFDYIAKKAGAGWPFGRRRFTNPDEGTATRALGSRALGHFRAMIDFAYKNNIDARFVILPLHRTYFDMLRTTGQDDFAKKWEQMLRRILRKAGEDAGRPPFHLWDMSDRRAYSGETVPAAGDRETEMKWFWDPGHCKAALGDIVLRQVLSPLASRSQENGEKTEAP